MKKERVKKPTTQKVKIDAYIPAIQLKKIPSEKALQLLNKAGYEINKEESEEVMEFLYTIVKLTLKEFFASD